MEVSLYDVIIIGAGPAGLTAGIYVCRARLKSLLIESQNFFSQTLFTDRIENYPGFPEGIDGFSLLDKFRKQAEGFGLEFSIGNVKGLKREGKIWCIATENRTYKCKAVIVATGVRPKKLGVEGEDGFLGKGVSYCAVCDGALFKDKDLVVIGGGDTAVEEAIFLSRFAKKIFLIHRRDILRATKILQERIFQEKKIEIVWNSVIEEICGKERIEKVNILNIKENKPSEIKCDGIFVAVGFVPNTEFLGGILELESGYIKTCEDMKTNAEGIFACGDCRNKSLRQIVTAVSDGAMAAISAAKYIEGLKGV